MTIFSDSDIPGPALDSFHLNSDTLSGNIAFLDIETTGLSASTSFLYLAGLLTRQEDGWSCIQYFAERPDGEQAVLKALAERLSKVDTVLTFRGTTFCLSYLKSKYKSFNLPDPFDGKKHFDLYRPLYPLAALFGLDHSTLDQFSRLAPGPEPEYPQRLSGKKRIPVYQKYVSGFFPENRDLLLFCNRTDLLDMRRLLPLLAYSRCFEGGFQLKSAQYVPTDSVHFLLLPNMPFPRPLPDLQIPLNKWIPFPKTQIPEKTVDLLNRSITLHDMEDGSIQVCVPAIVGEMKHFFPDYHNYYYLPLEDQAIHKSVSRFVDPSYRKPATASTCYIRQEGIFLPQKGTVIRPDFQDEGRTHFFRFEADTEEQPGILKTYLVKLMYDLYRVLNKK